MARLFALAPLARGPGRDEQLAALLSDGLLEVGDASPDEMFTALRVAPASQAQAAIELVSTGLEQAGTDPTKYPLSLALQRSSPEGAPPSAQFEGWLAALERRPVRAPESVVQSTPQVPPPPAPTSAPAHAPSGSSDASPALVPAPLPEPAGLQTSPPTRANPASTATPSTAAKPVSAACPGPAPCPNGG